MKLTAQDKQWRAESDAHTMASYQEIMNDPSRRKAAIQAARKQADELNKRAVAMQKAAGGPIKKAPVRKRK